MWITKVLLALEASSVATSQGDTKTLNVLLKGAELASLFAISAVKWLKQYPQDYNKCEELKQLSIESITAIQSSVDYLTVSIR